MPSKIIGMLTLRTNMFCPRSLTAVYQKVLAGRTISGPDHNINIDSIRDEDGNPDHIKFINQYVPTIRALLATYDFIDFGGGFTDVNNNPNERNDWVLDLNAGLDLLSPADPSPFANRCKPTVIYADGYSTPTWVSKILSGGDDVLFNFDDYQAGDVEPGVPWFAEGPSTAGGDKTVPQFSSIGQFVGDPRVTLKRISAGIRIIQV